MQGVCSRSLLILAGIFMSEGISGTALPKVGNGITNAPKWKTLDGEPSTYFAHRGETVLVTGHTLPAYEIAAIEQAEYVEPDLVLTKDGILVCYHDMTLKSGTDIEDHPEFEDRKVNYTGYIGSEFETIVNDYFLQNFTLDELKTLKVKQRKAGIRPAYFDTFQIPTFQEYLDVIHRTTITLNKTIGIIPELKHPSFHNRNLTANFMENQFIAKLIQNGYPLYQNETQNCTGLADPNNSSSSQPIKCPAVIIQCFEKAALEYLKNKTDLDLMMLVDPVVTLLTYRGLEEVAEVATWFCVWKEYLYVGVEKELEYLGREYNETEIDLLGGFIPATQFIVEAHRLGLKLSLFTINDSREPSRRGCAIVPGCEPENKREELFYYFDMGIDGIFIENVPESRELRLIYEYEMIGDEKSAGGNLLSEASTLHSQIFLTMNFLIFIRQVLNY